MRNANDPDLELLVRIRAGDRDAFDELVRKHYVALVRFAGSLIIGAGTEAEDVVQDVLYRTWHLREKLNPQSSIAAYLFAAARNAAFNVRKQARAIDRFKERLASNTLNNTLTGGSSLNDEISAALAKAFVRLPERQQTALRLRYKYEMGYADIASVLGVSSKAAERLLARGIASLREALGKKGGGNDSLKDLRGFLIPLIVIGL